MPQFLRANIKINEAMFHFLDNIVSEISYRVIRILSHSIFQQFLYKKKKINFVSQKFKERLLPIEILFYF